MLENATTNHADIYCEFLDHGDGDAGKWVLFEAKVTGKQICGHNRRYLNALDDEEVQESSRVWTHL